MQNYAILIDGGFAKRKLGTAKAPATAESFAAFILNLQRLDVLSAMRLHRIYYYDSVPLESTHERPLGGGTLNLGSSPIARRSKQLFEKLAQQPFVALRLGELSFEGWEINAKKLANASGASLEIVSGDLRPQIKQKGVDMRIGMDKTIDQKL